MILINRSSSTIRLLKGVQVLVVDNDRDNQDLYATLLQGYGANVVTCSSIEESLAIFAWLSPHILLCEMRFIGESIETLTTKLNDMERSGSQHIPAIAITTRITDSLVHLLNAGFGDYLLKPVDLDELVSMIRHLVHVQETKVCFHRSSLKAKLRVKRSAIARRSKELASFLPITPRSMMNQRQNDQLAKQEDLEQLKDDFLSTISHELRSPVTNIKMAIQMLKVLFQADEIDRAEITNRSGSASPSEQATTPPSCTCKAFDLSSLKTRATRYIQILERECDQEINLLNNFLELQQLDAGTYAFSHTEIQLENWLAQVIKPFLDRIATQQQSLHLDVVDQPTDMITDPISLGRVLSELLTNACKFTPPSGTITITVLFSESTTIDGSETLQLKVTNSGVEIPPHELPRIFDRFHRLPSNDRWKYSGTGLGLALVQKMTASLGGTIAAESGCGQTCFTVAIPVKVLPA